MNTNMKLSLELTANAAGLKAELGKSKSAVASFARGVKSELDALKNSFGGVKSQLAALGISIGALQQMTLSARLDKSLTQIGQTAGASGAEVGRLREELFAMSKSSGASVEDLKDGFNALVQSGLSMREAKETLAGINVAMAVTGANAGALSGGLTVAATAFQFDLAKPGKALELLDQMTVAGRLGNAELENLSSIFSRVGVNAASSGMGFEKTLAFIESLSMIERMPERLATLADSTLRVFTNLDYMAAAQKGTGVKFFDAKGARRDATAVLGDMKAKYDTLTTDIARESFIEKAFGNVDLDTKKGIRKLLTGDSLKQIDVFSKKIGDAGGTLKKDFNTATDNLIDQAGRLKNVLRDAADGFVQPITRALGNFIKFGLDKKENGGLGLTGKSIIVGGAALGLGAFAAARYGNMAIGGLAKKYIKGFGSTAAGIAEGKAIEAATGVNPVFVTNWPSQTSEKGGMSQTTLDYLGMGGNKSAGGIANAARSLKTILSMPALAGIGAAGLGTSAALVGGAALGGYGIGTAIEKMFIDGAIGNKIYDWLHGEAVKNEIKVDVFVDKDGTKRVTTEEKKGLNRGNLNPAAAY